MAAIVIYALLPGALQPLPRLAVPTIEGVLLIALVWTNPLRMNRETRWSRAVSVVLAALIIATNLLALGLLIRLLTSDHAQGGPLLIAAMQVWLTNLIGFALLYWELDRGGPVARRRLRRDQLPRADWRFTPDEDQDTIDEVAAGSSQRSGWRPSFIDYLYLSTTNSSAFSPTDTMPLSGRAKMLMSIQATSALLISLLVIARAISAFGS